MKKIISILFISFLVLSVYAQSADVITDILDAKEVTYGQVCYLSAVHHNLIEETSSYDEAVKVLFNEQQIPSLYDSDEVIPLINVAYIFSYMWDIKGGLMYRITGGAPRYVFKQFQADGIIASSVEPKNHISGADALSMYTACVRKYGNYDITAVSMGD